MNSPVCFLDMDGVLVDFVGGALKAHSKELPPKEVMWNFNEQIGLEPEKFWEPFGFSFWAGLEWTSEGPLLLWHLETMFGENNIVLMTTPCLTMGGVEGKIEWIRKRLPNYSRRFFIGPPKHLAAGPKKVLIDDSDRNTDDFNAHGGRSILVPRSWNRLRDETCERGLFDVRKVIETVKRLIEQMR